MHPHLTNFMVGDNQPSRENDYVAVWLLSLELSFWD